MVNFKTIYLLNVLGVSFSKVNKICCKLSMQILKAADSKGFDKGQIYRNIISAFRLQRAHWPEPCLGLP